MSRSLRLAVLVSGEGTTLEGLAEPSIERGELPATIVLVVADRPHAPRDRARSTPRHPDRGPADRGVARRRMGRPARHGASGAAEPSSSCSPASSRSSRDAWLDRWAGPGHQRASFAPAEVRGPRVLRSAGPRGGPRRRGAGDRRHRSTSSRPRSTRGPVLAQERLPVEPSDTPETPAQPVFARWSSSSSRRRSVASPTARCRFPIPGPGAIGPG